MTGLHSEALHSSKGVYFAVEPDGDQQDIKFQDVELSTAPYFQASKVQLTAINRVDVPPRTSSDSDTRYESWSLPVTECNSEKTKSTYRNRLKQSLAHRGWKFGLRLGLYASVFVLIGNFIILLVGCFTHGGFKHGIGTIAIGTPAEVERLSTVYHILINIISTVLLIASNYAMQILCAPTRVEIDKAHSEGSWVDIGLMSLRNLRHVNKRKVYLWSMLGLSSIPLHLFYNSAIFHVVGGQDYWVDAMNTTAANATGKAWTRFDNQAWRHLYKAQFPLGYGNLHLVISNVSLDIHIHENSSISYEWPASTSVGCDWAPWYPENRRPIQVAIEVMNGSAVVSNDTTSQRAVFDQDNKHFSPRPKQDYWPKFGSHPVNVTNTTAGVVPIGFCGDTDWLAEAPFLVDHALAEPVEGTSKVQIALSFLLVVIGANTMKVIAIYSTLQHSSSNHILTVGDAVSSFLEQPEFDTVGKCTLQRSDIGLQYISKPWKTKRKRMLVVIGDNLKMSGCVIIVLLFISLILLGPATTSLNNRGFGHQWGTASKLLIPFTKSSFDTKNILFNAWLANTPQILLSVGYFGINRLVTSVHFAKEWNSYASHHRGLRVSSPHGEQRPTRFLQIPLSYAIPLGVVSGLLHWMLSQALFLVRFEVRTTEGELYPQSTCACGYSPLSVVMFTFVLLILVLSTFCLLLVKMKIRIPVAGHCSAVISAACHPPPDDRDAQLKKVKWSVVRNRFGGDIQHCTFTSEEVTKPEDGETYA